MAVKKNIFRKMSYLQRQRGFAIRARKENQVLNVIKFSIWCGHGLQIRAIVSDIKWRLKKYF
ncbi:hypothetical protein C4F50_12240 [Flavobacterium sp. KB82]|uniref:Uncharacterized protein n=1 Tax=Flavobacterium hungaricum TaxID=2082725 RepID=A0ABR9TK23_9FLAO|nr:hypothetical protein [Flavobacterium hungaricum]